MTEHDDRDREIEELEAKLEQLRRDSPTPPPSSASHAFRAGRATKATPRWIILALVGTVVVFVVVGTSGRHHGAPPSDSAEATAASKSAAAATAASDAAAAVAEAASKDNATQLMNSFYLAQKYLDKANASCIVLADDYLRSIAKYDFAWDKDTPSFFGAKIGGFDRFLEYVTSPGVLTVISTKVKLQNGFGALQHIPLYCNYDTQKDELVSFSTDPPMPMETPTATHASATPLPTAPSATPRPVETVPQPPPAASTDAPDTNSLPPF